MCKGLLVGCVLPSPTGFGGLPGYFGTPLRRHLGCPCRAALEAAAPAKRDGSGVLAIERWWRFTILDLTAGDVDHQLGELGGVAWAFESLVRHDANMRRVASRF